MDAPSLVAFEVTTRCNLRCVMCPHGVEAVVNPRDADPGLVDKVWPAMAAARTVHLNGVGEPLLAEPFWTIIDRLSGRSTPRVDFNTNGLLLSEANIQRLSRAPLGTVLVSFDAATAETYSRIRGGSFSKVVEGARRLVRRLGDRADIKMTFVFMRENLDEMIGFVDLAHAVGVASVWFGPLTEPALSSDRWQVRRPSGWTFNYAEQKIEADDPEARRRLAAAAAHGGTLGVKVEGAGMWREAMALGA